MDIISKKILQMTVLSVEYWYGETTSKGGDESCISLNVCVEGQDWTDNLEMSKNCVPVVEWVGGEKIMGYLAGYVIMQVFNSWYVFE